MFKCAMCANDIDSAVFVYNPTNTYCLKCAKQYNIGIYDPATNVLNKEKA